jgi:uncharacterized protein YqgC (DUF456 family)
MNKEGSAMGKGKLIGKIFGIAVSFPPVGPMFGKTASTVINKHWQKQLESFRLTGIH